MARETTLVVFANSETLDHYFLRWPRYSTQRYAILNSPNAMFSNMNTVKYCSDLLHSDDLINFHNSLRRNEHRL